MGGGWGVVKWGGIKNCSINGIVIDKEVIVTTPPPPSK